MNTDDPICPTCGGRQGYPNSLTHHGAIHPCWCRDELTALFCVEYEDHGNAYVTVVQAVDMKAARNKFMDENPSLEVIDVLST